MKAERGTVCGAFHWIGQALDMCDHCGHPYWEHSHDSVGGKNSSIIRPFRRIIPTEQAMRARAKWFGYSPVKYQCECYNDWPIIYPIPPAHERLAAVGR